MRKYRYRSGDPWKDLDVVSSGNYISYPSYKVPKFYVNSLTLSSTCM